MKRIILSLIFLIQIIDYAIPQTIQAPNSSNYLSYINDLSNGFWSFITGTGYLLGNIPPPYSIAFSNSPDITGPFPSSFDLRNTNNVTPVKHQGSCGSCWAFATMGALESEWKVAGYGTYNLSENNLIHGNKFLGSPCNGGNLNKSIAYLARMAGPIDSTSDPYNPSGNYYISNVPPLAFVSDVRYIKWRSNSGINIIKKAIMDYGGLYTSMRWEDGSYNASNYSYWYNGIKAPNHAVIIVGWDNSKITPAGNGAWIVKNSWENFGEAGYFYVSYLDNRILTDGAAYFPTRISYTSNAKILGYDDLGATTYRGYNTNVACGLVKFTTLRSIQLSKISTYVISENSTIDIEVFHDFDGTTLSNPIVSMYNLVCENPGFYTFDLPFESTINRGQNFFIKIKYTTPYTIFPLPCEQAIDNYASPVIESGKCWTSPDGNIWTQIGSGTNENFDLCINAYCVDNPNYVKSMEYFIDSDPGIGNGTVIESEPDSILTFDLNLPMMDLMTGIHSLYVRARNISGIWGQTQKIPFYRYLTSDPNLARLEYFFDNDPGFGRGHEIQISANQYLSLSYNIPLNSLSSGIHTLYIRVKDNYGKWSVVQSTPIYKLNDNPLVTLSKVEYFFDSDPGFEHGTVISLNSSQNEVKTFSIGLTGLTNGIHTLFVRAKDSNGRWSLLSNTPIYKFNAISQPNINQIEYYIDSDPGFGSGVHIPVLPSSPNSTILFSFPYNNLTSGNHLLYVRSRDNSGKWSLVSTAAFTTKPLNVTLLLEGLYNPTTGLMNHAQDEFGNHFVGEVADQISLEIRQNVFPYPLIQSLSNLNVTLSGSCEVSIPSTLTSSYYLVIKHRNSIETWSASPLSFSGSIINYSFSEALSQAYGNNLKLISGKYCIYGGNVNQDGVVDGSDMALIDNASTGILRGYLNTDANGDGVVDASDMSIVDNNSTSLIQVKKP
ncbi:MAG: hypothetical protein HXX13_16105 [Bacteroidetes bacterium]|nr:hypothetical protein [Bacteroidota bacterium]